MLNRIGEEWFSGFTRTVVITTEISQVDSLKIHPLRPVQNGLPSIVLSQPEHRYRTPLAGRREDAVLNERAPIHQIPDALIVHPELAVGLHTLEIVQNEPCPPSS